MNIGGLLYVQEEGYDWNIRRAGGVAAGGGIIVKPSTPLPYTQA
jgi:hypothetical protein